LVAGAHETNRKLAEKRARQEEARKARLALMGIDIP